MPRPSSRLVPILLCALALAGASAAVPAADAAVIRPTALLDDNVDNGNCTLREAVIAANANAPKDGCPAGTGSDEIRLRPGTYELSVGPAGEDAAAGGDLDLSGVVKISGAEEGSKVDANSLDRVFDVRAGAATFDPLTITGGRVAGDGGGIQVFGGAVANVVGTKVTGNTANAGGGIDVWPNATANVHESLVANNSTVTGNPAGADDGGGIDVDGANARLNLTRSAVVGNVASEQGGGIEAEEGGLVAIANSTISGNRALGEPTAAFRAGFGGGVRTFGAATTVTIANSTISDNSAGAGGGGVQLEGAVTRIRGTLISANTAPSGPDCSGVATPLISQGFNLIGNPSTCAVAPQVGDRLGLDPQLRPIADNGGPTPTHALPPGSPAVDKGPGDAPRFDQRGAPRRARPDIGSYERVECAGQAVNRVGAAGVDRLLGTGRADAFLGLGGGDRIAGRGGRDRVCAGAGKDTVFAGAGADLINGGGGADDLRGQAGRDSLRGQGGSDDLRGGGGRDRISGGAGRGDRCDGGGGRRDAATASCERQRRLP